MSGFIDNTSNIDAAEIAAEYRTPEQGVVLSLTATLHGTIIEE